MSRSSHTPPMPTHADLMLAEKLRRELGGEAVAREDADTQPENVTHLPAVEAEDPNKKYVPLASPPRRARVKTEPMANVIVGVTNPPVAPARRPPAPPRSRRAETTAPGRRSPSLAIPMEKRGVMIGIAIVLAAGMLVSAIFVVGASTGAPAVTPPTTATVATTTIATTTMATVVVPTSPASPAATAPIPEALDPTPSPTPRPRGERSDRPANAPSATSAAQHSSARATTTPAVVETTKDDIERKIR